MFNFNWVVEIIAKKYSCFSPKIGEEEEKMYQNPFSVILRQQNKQKPMRH